MATNLNHSPTSGEDQRERTAFFRGHQPEPLADKRRGSAGADRIFFVATNLNHSPTSGEDQWEATNLNHSPTSGEDQWEATNVNHTRQPAATIKGVVIPIPP